MSVSTTERPYLAAVTAGSPTVLWTDGADPEDLSQSIGFGAVGATCNPVIAYDAIRRRPEVWEPRIAEIALDTPTWGEAAISWAAIERLSVESARLLELAFAASGGQDGRLSIQTDTRLYRDSDALAAQAVELSRLAPNIIVKIPATAAGIRAMEEAAYRGGGGVSINATVSFTVSQAVAVGEALERAIDRRLYDGMPEQEFGHVVTIMGGRLDDWLMSWTSAHGILMPPGVLDWAGVAVLKRAHALFVERGFRSRILSAAFRSFLQWSELQGGDLVVSPPFHWQQLIDSNKVPAGNRIDVPVAPETLDALLQLREFERVYEIDGMPPTEFETFGVTRNTLRQFLMREHNWMLLSATSWCRKLEISSSPERAAP